MAGSGSFPQDGVRHSVVFIGFQQSRSTFIFPPRTVGIFPLANRRQVAGVGDVMAILAADVAAQPVGMQQ
jgi:hypothetical protein